MKVLKASNLVQVAEYAMARNIGEEPSFAWWIHYVLRKRDVIISAVNSQVCKTSPIYRAFDLNWQPLNWGSLYLREEVEKLVLWHHCCIVAVM